MSGHHGAITWSHGTVQGPAWRPSPGSVPRATRRAESGNDPVRRTRGGSEGEAVATERFGLRIRIAAYRGGATALESAIAIIPGVARVRVDAASGMAWVDYDPAILTADALLRVVRGLALQGAASDVCPACLDPISAVPDP